MGDTDSTDLLHPASPCLSACLSVCLSLCLSVSYTDLQTSSYKPDIVIRSLQWSVQFKTISAHEAMHLRPAQPEKNEGGLSSSYR